MKRLLLVLALVVAACSPTRHGSLPPVAEQSMGVVQETPEQLRIRSALPDGAEIYRLDTVTVNDAGRNSGFPATATFRTTGSHLEVTSNGKVYVFTASSTVARVGGGEFYHYPGTPLPAILRGRTPDEVVHSLISASTARSALCEGDAAYATNRRPQAARRPSDYCDSGLPFVTDQTAGAVSSFSADSCSFSASFENPYSNATYNYSYTLYDANGKAVYSSPMINGGSLIGSQGMIWTDTSSYTYSRVQFIVTLFGGNDTAYTGNAHAHQP